MIATTGVTSRLPCYHTYRSWAGGDLFDPLPRRHRYVGSPDGGDPLRRWGTKVGDMEGAGIASGAVKAADVLEVAAVIVTDPVIDQIRRELRRRTGHNMDHAELSELITSSVLRPDALGRARSTVVCGIPVGRMEDLAG